MKSSHVLSVFVGFFSFASLHASPKIFNIESSINRPGFDYRSFEQKDPDINLCRIACEDDTRCQAFTFVRPGEQGPNARCWLKFATGLPVQNAACESGVKATTKEPGWEHNGPDYMNFNLPSDGQPEDCESRCVNDLKCKAYVYMYTNHQRSTPHCWLKSSYGFPIWNDFAYSGTINR